jgi:integrase
MPVNQDREFVFPAHRGRGHLTDVKVFKKTCEKAGLEGVTLHVLRHSFASTALELEYSELTIAGLLGHRSHSVTARYAHHLDRALAAAADRVSNLIAARMAGREADGAEIVELYGAR